jgi:hypothetical protein
MNALWSLICVVVTTGGNLTQADPDPDRLFGEQDLNVGVIFVPTTVAYLEGGQWHMVIQVTTAPLERGIETIITCLHALQEKLKVMKISDHTSELIGYIVDVELDYLHSLILAAKDKLQVLKLATVVGTQEHVIETRNKVDNPRVRPRLKPTGRRIKAKQ